MFLCDLHPANIGQEAMALNHKNASTPFILGVSLLTGMSAFILGSQGTLDDPTPPQHQHLFSLAWCFSFQSLHSHHEHSAAWSWRILLMWLSPLVLSQEDLL